VYLWRLNWIHFRLKNPSTGRVWFLTELWFNDFAFKDSHAFDVEVWIKPYGVYVLAAIVQVSFSFRFVFSDRKQQVFLHFFLKKKTMFTA
jgi:hypothetical protein